MLICVTKKRLGDLRETFPNPHLLRNPFDRVVSRLKYKPDLFKFKLVSESIEEILARPNLNLNWDECCALRAKQLLALKKDKYYVSYSGGIDSTTAVVSLLKFWPAADLEKVVLCLSHHSIEENKTIFKDVMSRFPFISIYENMSRRLLTENAIFVTGELGDQLFGSDLLAVGSKKFGDGCFKEDFKSIVPKILTENFGDSASGYAIFERLEPIVHEAPFPIRNTHDFLWWYNFSQKWQHVKMRFLQNVNWDLRARYGSHVAHFFDSPEFQHWSINNHDLKLKNEWKSYKHTAKEFIYDFTKCAGDLELLKVQSLKNTFFYEFNRIGIHDDYRELKSAEELSDYVIDRI